MTCNNCGKTKAASRFPRKHGPYYEKMSVADPKRYQKQCKLCSKPLSKPGDDRTLLKEPKFMIGGRPKGTKNPATLAKKAWRKANPNAVRSQHKVQARMKVRIRSMQYLSSKGCESCGERDPRKLEYDHKDPADKKFVISRLFSDGHAWSDDKLRREISKCRILCAGCHRVHTIEQQGYYASDAVQDTLRDLSRKYGFKLQ